MDFCLHQLERRKRQERPGSVLVPTTRACAVESHLATFLSPGHVHFSFGPAAKTPAQYWAMDVRDCEHDHLSPDTNGKDSSASPWSVICSAGFRKTFFKFGSFFQMLILGKKNV